MGNKKELVLGQVRLVASKDKKDGLYIILMKKPKEVSRDRRWTCMVVSTAVAFDLRRAEFMPRDVPFQVTRPFAAHFVAHQEYFARISEKHIGDWVADAYSGAIYDLAPRGVLGLIGAMMARPEEAHPRHKKEAMQYKAWLLKYVQNFPMSFRRLPACENAP